VRGSVEVHPVDNAFERRVGLGDAVQVGREALANLAGELANDRPDRVIGIIGLERQVEADELMVLSTSLNALAREPTSLAIRFNSSSKTSHSRLVKISGRMKSLNLGASCAPRMLHAASQIQDSSDLPFPLVILPHLSTRILHGIAAECPST
jgi:hypothetical protein